MTSAARPQLVPILIASVVQLDTLEDFRARLPREPVDGLFRRGRQPHRRLGGFRCFGNCRQRGYLEWNFSRLVAAWHGHDQADVGQKFAAGLLLGGGRTRSRSGAISLGIVDRSKILAGVSRRACLIVGTGVVARGRAKNAHAKAEEYENFCHAKILSLHQNARAQFMSSILIE